MSEISYFQRYSQKENHITNNTMLMFRHLYRHSPARFESLLEEIAPASGLQVGLKFNQQERHSDSISDATITQNAFKVYIEAKADGELYEEQLQRHINSITNDNNLGVSLLVGLSKRAPSRAIIDKFVNAENRAIPVIFVTYADLLDSLNRLCAAHEVSLLEIIEDYEDFLRSQQMLPNPFGMVVFPSGTSWNENIKYQIYYEQADKSSKSHVKYIGIYTNKEITHIGEIASTCIGRLIEGKFSSGDNSISGADAKRIEEIIGASSYYADLGAHDHRYYIIKSLHEVNLIKKSSGGIRGHRYFDLQKFSNEKFEAGMDIEKIADLVKGKQFDYIADT